jgi:hypothetical protein
MKTAITKAVILVLLLVGFVIPYLLEGGRLAALLHIVPIFSLLSLTYGFCAFRLGLGPTHAMIFSLFSVTNDQFRESGGDCDEVFFVNAVVATHLVGLGIWMNILQHLTSKEHLGHYVAAMMVTYSCGLVLLTIAPSSKPSSTGRMLAITATAMMGVLGSALSFMKFS